jgi:hypothetical protein
MVRPSTPVGSISTDARGKLSSRSKWHGMPGMPWQFPGVGLWWYIHARPSIWEPISMHVHFGVSINGGAY